MATKKAAKKISSDAKVANARSMPKAGKNPKGGLTDVGRAYFARREGSHLKPGVTGAADTPEKMRRKGSFLRRHFTHPRGPVQDEQGRPTRLALSAHAWGEPVPKDMAAAKKLAAKGHALLEKYHSTQTKSAAKKTTMKRAARKATTKSAATKQGKTGGTGKSGSLAKKSGAKRSSQRR